MKANNENLVFKQYLEDKGIIKYGNVKFKCLNEEHIDKNPSMSFWGNRVYCFQCRARYNFAEVISIVEDLPIETAWEKTEELYNKTKWRNDKKCWYKYRRN